MDEQWMALLAEELQDLKQRLMDVSRNRVQVGELGQGYKPGVSELADVLKWLRAYELGQAEYAAGCALLHQGNEAYNAHVDWKCAHGAYDHARSTSGKGPRYVLP